MMFLAILGLILTLAGIFVALVSVVVSIDEDDAPVIALSFIFLIVMLALAIWQPVYWFTGVA